MRVIRKYGLPLAVLAVASVPTSCAPANQQGSLRSSPRDQAEADLLRATERARLRALVDGNVDRARGLHSPDFQLITPAGTTVTKEQYLGFIASGQLDYLYWEPDSIAVRMYENSAVIRYRSQLEVNVFGTKVSRRPYWHTDVYEKRDGRWQAVWSQATEIRPAP